LIRQYRSKNIVQAHVSACRLNYFNEVGSGSLVRKFQDINSSYIIFEDSSRIKAISIVIHVTYLGPSSSYARFPCLLASSPSTKSRKAKAYFAAQEVGGSRPVHESDPKEQRRNFLHQVHITQVRSEEKQEKPDRPRL
jgi:hypothetical protein